MAIDPDLVQNAQKYAQRLMLAYQNLQEVESLSIQDVFVSYRVLPNHPSPILDRASRQHIMFLLALPRLVLAAAFRS